VRVPHRDDFGPVVESFSPEGVSYTAYADEGSPPSTGANAAAAFLLQR